MIWISARVINQIWTTELMIESPPQAKLRTSKYFQIRKSRREMPMKLQWPMTRSFKNKDSWVKSMKQNVPLKPKSEWKKLQKVYQNCQGLTKFIAWTKVLWFSQRNSCKTFSTSSVSIANNNSTTWVTAQLSRN